MKHNSKNMKKGVSMALTAMMVLPTTTAAYASPINETTKEKKVENVPYNVLNQKVLSNSSSSTSSGEGVGDGITQTPTDEVKQVYLSDLGYVKGQSSVGWDSIKVNQNINGGTIKLIVDGERTEFTKGMGAHATSNLVFDISQYSNEYTRLVTYMGIDASQGGNGDGVKFVISTSDDGKSWKEVKTTGVIKGSNESIYVDLRLNGAKFIKLHANQNGGNGNDHAVYGDLKLVKDDYSLSQRPITGLKTVEEYDAILSNNTIEENMENQKMTILQRAFVNRVGYESLQRLAGKSDKYAEAIDYLMNDETALNYFITGGAINKGGSHQATVRHFCDIYSNYEAELKETWEDNFNLRLAISISLAYSREEMVGFWERSNKDRSALTRYETFQTLVASGKMDIGGNADNHTKWSTQEFKNLPIPLMRLVVDSRINDDEAMWLLDLAISEKAKGNNHVNAYNYIEYTVGYNYNNPRLFDENNKEEFNNKYGNFLNYFNDYGKKDVYRLWMVFEEGSVCGGLAQTYSALAEVLGRPSSPSGQPGHAASLTYYWNKDNNRYEWTIQNDITGWNQTNNQYEDRMLGWGNQSWAHYHSGGVYTVLATDSVLDENYSEVALLNLLADSYDEGNKKEVYENVLELQPKNLDAIEGLINRYLNDDTKGSADYLELAKKVVETYTYYPKVMMEILTLIEGKITNVGEIAQLDLMKYNALLKASKATPEVTPNVAMSKQTASKYLEGEQSSELATFSFDGENANKIMINSKYGGSDIRVKYSLDSGDNWIETDEHEILLSKEQLASITAENNIIVGLVGATDDFNYTIDILEGRTITSSTIYANDDENLLLGNVENLEFSIDGGNEWCDYVVGNEDSINPNNVTGIRIEGDQTVKVRYKANSLHLQSAEVEYDFTENTDTDDRKYVQLKNVSFVDASAPNGNSHKGDLMLDGMPETGYHTRFNHTTKDKFFIVKFDQPRYISSMEYMFAGGNNGRLKSGEIQASLDGVNWETIKTFNNMPRDINLQAFDMDLVVKAEYIKIVATETHGNGNGEANMYLAGKELKFYEDTTVVDKEPEVPELDFDSEMEVNPDTDQVVDDTPIVLPDDVVIENKPSDEDSVGDDDMGVGEDGTGDDNNTVTPEEDEPNVPPTVQPQPQPPVEDDNVDDTTPPTVTPQPQPKPPVSSGGGSVQPPSTEDKPSDETTPTNGIENLKDLDKELQEKVNSIIAESVIGKQGLTLSIVGDDNNLKHVSHVEVTKDGIFAVVDGNKLKFGATLEGLDLDLANARVIRIDQNRNSIGKYTAVSHQKTKDGLNIYSSNLENLLITYKVSEPFVDVNDTDWFKADVEEAYNYGFTQGTSLNTYNPHGKITRGEFAVMIARALELKVEGNTGVFKDVKGKWYENEVQALKDAGIVSGFEDGTFGGNKNITRQEAAKMLLNVLEYVNVDTTTNAVSNLVDMDSVNDFAKHAVQFLAEMEVLVGDENKKFNPTNNLTRAEMAKVLVRSLKLSNLY